MRRPVHARTPLFAHRVGQQLGRRSTSAGFIAADLQAADREAQTLVAGLSEQQMNCLHHVE